MGIRIEGASVKAFGRSFHRGWLVLVGCCFVQMGGVGMVLLPAGVFYSPVCEELGFMRSEIALWMTAYFLATIPTMPLVARAFEKYGIRRPMCMGTVIVALAVAMLYFGSQPWHWVLSGALVGAAGSFVLMMPSAVLVGNWFLRKSGFAMGLTAACSALSGAIMSPVFQLLIETLGWRLSYMVMGCLVLVLVLPWPAFVFVLSPRDCGAQPYGWSEDTGRRILERRCADPNGVDEILQEDCAKGISPGVPLRKAIRTVSFYGILVFVCIGAFFGSGYDPHMPSITVCAGYSAATGALMLSTMQLGSFCDKLLMGVITDRFGVATSIAIELACMAVGFLGLLFAPNLPVMFVSAFLFGVQDSIIAVSFPLLVRRVFGTRDFSRIYAWFRVGVGIFGSFASVLVGLAYDLNGNYDVSLIAGCAMVVVAAVAVLVALIGQKRIVWE